MVELLGAIASVSSLPEREWGQTLRQGALEVGQAMAVKSAVWAQDIAGSEAGAVIGEATLLVKGGEDGFLWHHGLSASDSFEKVAAKGKSLTRRPHAVLNKLSLADLEKVRARELKNCKILRI